jgi:hypothetical protein
MRVISVDLASRSYGDVGVVLLEYSLGRISASLIRPESLELVGEPNAPELGEALAALAADHGSQAFLLDGPQGWKAPENGLEHSRRCEKELATQGKTGLPGHTKPASFRRFAEFSVELFDVLDALGFPRLARRNGGPGQTSAEVYPTSAWRALEISPLPSKRRATGSDISERLRVLEATVGLSFHGAPNHDELQAMVAGVAVSSLASGEWSSLPLAGTEPLVLHGTWREGYILNPELP